VHTEKSNKIGASELYAINSPRCAPPHASVACRGRTRRLSPQHPSLLPVVRRLSPPHPSRVRIALVRSVACPSSIRRLSPQHQLLSLVPCRLSSGLCHLTPGPPPSSIGCLSPPYPPLVTTASAACLRCMMASIQHPSLVTVACASVVCPLWVPRLSPPHRSHVAAVSSSFPYSICHLSPQPSLLASVLTASVPSCRVSCPRCMCIRQLSPAAPLLVPAASVKCPHCIRRLSPPHLSHVPAASVSIACRLPHPSPPIPSHAPAASRVRGLTQPPLLLVPAASAPCPRRVRCLFLSLRPLTPPAGTARQVRQLDLLQHGLHSSGQNPPPACLNYLHRTCASFRHQHRS
jgi:hypothetical protein